VPSCPHPDDRAGVAHPLTGAPPDYYWIDGQGVSHPRWRDAYARKGPMEHRWFSTGEVAGMIGRTRQQVWRYVSAGAIPATRVGMPGAKRSNYFIRGSDFLTFMASQSRVVAVMPDGPERK
jgi:hypothetical protein